MGASRDADDRTWLAEQVANYEQLRPDYRRFADALAEVLRGAVRDLAPLAIVQAREKSIASFAAKALYKRSKYDDPVRQFTDLCGARVITRTRAEVERVCRYIEQRFVIDWANSLDAGQRLKPSEFGYRSIHYIAAFRPDGGYGVAIPDAIVGLKAEVQVRTLVEHAYADFGHDLTYKGAFTLPVAWQRELASAAAALEEVDGIFSRLEERLTAYATSYGAYLSPEAIEREAAILAIILEHDPGNAALAARLGKLAITREAWDEAIAVLTRHVDDAQPAGAPAGILCDLGVALCKASSPGTADYHRGQRYLEAAGAAGNVDALCALAGTWKGTDEARVRELYGRAFQADPADAYALTNHLECELRNGVAVLPTARPLIREAIERCEAHIAAGINLPWAYYSLGKCRLLEDDPYGSLADYAKAVQLSPAPWMIETSLKSLERLAEAGCEPAGMPWIRRLLLLGLALRHGSAGAVQQLRQLATPGAPPLRAPVRIVAGGTAREAEPRLREFAPGLREAFADYAGTLISGGTMQGVCALVGDVAEAMGSRVHTVGYVPATVPADVTVDPCSARYRELRVTDGRDFSPLESLQQWTDLAASAVPITAVRLLGFGGGTIAAAEYVIALALGARVGLLVDGGGAAARIAADGRWSSTPGLVALARDPLTVGAFLCAQTALPALAEVGS